MGRLIVGIFLLILTFSLPSMAESNIKVGVYLSMTGPVAAWGRVEWQGIKMAHEMIKKVNKKNIDLLLEDVASKPEGAALAAEKLVDERVKFVVGPVASFAALSAIPIFEKAKVVDVIPTANAKGLTKGKSFISRVCFSNQQQAKVMANYIYSSGKKKGVIVEDLSQDYSVDLAKDFINSFKKIGGEISEIFYISSSDTDFSALAAQIKSSNADFVYFTTYYPSIALILRDLRMIKCNIPAFAGSAASSYALLKIAGRAAEGLIFTDDFDPLIPQTQESRKFISLFRKRYNRLPDSPEALAADAYLLLVKAIEKGDENPQKVAQFARNTTFYGITGKIIIKNGIVKRTIVLRQVKDGKFKPVAVFEP
ncbi:ABC transporter substrate-binding protein [Hippea alviniae]|uniref:ABC transporter substrate-binding protein n=1 Tax=Hippea alviniae TaxID=1279027 RepID=UPI0003B69035|nr:ABC transporter substrate-binding protein [Hippea alviniae]